MASLFQKTLVGQIILFGVVALTTSAFSAWNLYRQLTDEYRSKGSAIALSIASSSETLLGASPAETTQAIVDQFLKIRGVAYVFVVDANGNIIVHTFVPAVPSELLHLTQVNDRSEAIAIRDLDLGKMKNYTDISAPILAGAAGYVHVGMDRGLILQQIQGGIAQQLVLIFFLFLVSAIATYIMVKRVSQPLNQLSEYATKLAAKDFSARIKIRSRDEIGLLATTMQSMAKEMGGFVGRLEKAVDDATSELHKTLEALRIEQQKSERLLLNMLPKTIAERLKEGQSNIANGFAEVTILFADIVGFTKLSERISPAQLVDWLNELFSGFDRLCEEHDLEKIKTIGDAYMVVGGLPTPRSDHAEAIAEMAIAMLQEIQRFNLKHHADLDIRIGINTGPVVAGVIGTKKFIYDLWGDAVNTASRMESHGIPGGIQVTAKTYERLKNKYQLEYRGVVEIKGKGEMDTYLLKGLILEPREIEQM